MASDKGSAALEATRERLRQALVVIAYPPKPKPLFGDGIGGIGRALRGRIHDAPLLGLVQAGAQSWWRKQPARKVALVVAAASTPPLAQLQRKNPGAVMVCAVGLGVLLALARPWQWLFRPVRSLKLLSGLALHMARRAPSVARGQTRSSR